MLNARSLSPGLASLAGAPDKVRAVVATLLYYDLFVFPPSSEELARFAHRGGVDGHFDPGELAPESEWWSCRDGYWFLKGREMLIARRAELRETSARKMKRARQWAKRLSGIPGMRFVGVTGSLSMESAVAEDDIDLLIITASGRLWLTRALVLGMLWAARVKRGDDGRSYHPDQICANIFLSEDDLHLPDHNLFIAHEICQMVPLVGRETYNRFLASNKWICEFLPQWAPANVEWEDRPIYGAIRRAGEVLLGGSAGARLEGELGRRQLLRIHGKHARGHNTGIKLSQTQLRFHPRDISQYVVDTFDERWARLNSSPRGPGGPW